MIEHVHRLVGPSTIIIFEVEGPSRVSSTASTRAEWDRLAHWITQSPERDEALRWALRESVCPARL